MNNKSIIQVKREINTARKQSRSNPYRNEIGDTVDGENTLSDLMGIRNLDSTGNQIVPQTVKEKLVTVFANFETQYKILGLYYAAGFTVEEISLLEGMAKQNVSISLRRAVKRLRKYLTVQEYDSIRWLLRDYKRIPGNVTVIDRSYLGTYTCQDREQFPYHK